MKKSCSPSRTKSWTRWLQGRFSCAFNGLYLGIFKDKSVRLQAMFGLMALAAAFLLGCTAAEWLWVLLSIALVLAAEMFNTCIEKTVDYISLEKNPQAKIIKDMAAGAVMIVSLFALAAAFLVLAPRAWLFVKRYLL